MLTFSYFLIICENFNALTFLQSQDFKLPTVLLLCALLIRNIFVYILVILSFN